MPKQKLVTIGNENICPVAVIIRGGKILLGLRHYTKDKWKLISVWTTPGGRCNTNESLGSALHREVKEEIGVDDLEIIEYLGEVPGAKYSNDHSDIVPLFLCKTNQEPKLMEPQKFSEWRWFAPLDIPDNFINPAALEIIKEKVFD
ncbi:MAG: NUDIX hydrolase [Candidatus Vogelbacteria bacterium]|nr:NUDIX hydrolase [Candidatus Vogelbacteria bacterium]